MKRLTLLGIIALSFSAAAEKPGARTLETLTVQEAKFGDGPESSVKVALIYGEPDKKGMFIQWMKMPPGTQTPPHWHTSDEIFTVLSGSIGLGIGEKFDESVGKEIKAGGFAVVPAKVHHFGWSKEGAVIQVQGMGPFNMNWLKP